MAYPVTAAFKQALASSDQQAVVSVEVWHGTSRLAVLGGATGSLVSGSVSATETAEIRRTATLSIQSRGRTLDDLVWKYPTDLLHPASGNELRIWRGFRYAGGITELVPLGVFGLTKPKAVDTGSGLAITVNGYDRSGTVKRQPFDAPFVIATGTPLDTVAVTVVSARIPGAAFNLYPSAAKLPALTWAATPAGSTNDPMALLQGVFGDHGLELFFDANGILTSRPIPTPARTPVAWTLAEGETGTLVQVAKTEDTTATYNGVVLVGNGKAKTVYSTKTTPTHLGNAESTIPQVVGEWWTTTPTSPVNVTRYGKVPYRITSTAIPSPSMNGPTGPTGGLTGPNGAQTLANAAAKAQASIACTALNTVTFSCVPNPAMQEGDVAAIARKRMGLATPFVVSAFTIPLGVATAETGTCRPQLQKV